MTGRLEGKVAIVTGAARGQGEAEARRFVAEGASVLLTDVLDDEGQAVAESLGEAAAYRHLDVSSEDEWIAAVADAEARFGPVTILVNNAGILDFGSIEHQDVEKFRRVIDVNLVGLFHLTQLAARPMLVQGSGAVVNVASILGLVSAAPIPNAAYCASKGAVVNLTRELAVQWARKGVRVNALAPGWFETEMTQEMFADEKGLAFLERNAPMARGGREHELDGALLFLASDASSYVTGHTLVVDGGWTAR